MSTAVKTTTTSKFDIFEATQKQQFVSSSQLTLKTNFNGDLRRRSLSLESGFLGFGAVGRYEQFSTFICSIYNIDNCRFYYIDEESERIRISCDEEVCGDELSLIKNHVFLFIYLVG